jgi:hypothetical protein
MEIDAASDRNQFFRQAGQRQETFHATWTEVRPEELGVRFERDTGRGFYRHSSGEVRGLGSRLDIGHDHKAASGDQKSIFDGQKQFHSRPP